MIHPILKFLEDAPFHPSLDYITNPKMGSADVKEWISKHMAECKQCQEMVQFCESIEIPDCTEALEKINRILEEHPVVPQEIEPTPFELAVGQIWSTKMEYQGIITWLPYDVMIQYIGDGILRVIPISQCLEFVDSDDVVADTPDGVQLLEFWNETPCVPEHLMEYRGMATNKRQCATKGTADYRNEFRTLEINNCRYMVQAAWDTIEF